MQNGKTIKVPVDSIAKQASKTPTRPATRDSSAATPKLPKPTASGSPIWDLTPGDTVPDKPMLYRDALCIPVMHMPAANTALNHHKYPMCSVKQHFHLCHLLDNQHHLLDHHLQLLDNQLPLLDHHLQLLDN